MKNTLYLSLTLCLCLLFGGCLTYEKKDVSFSLNAGGSLSVRVKYYNILSDSLADAEQYDCLTGKKPPEINGE